MRVAILLNAGAGTLARLGQDGPARVRAAFEEAGVAADLKIVESRDLKDTIDGLAAGHEASGLDGIVVGGGDGTIGCAASRLAGTGVPLGILPLGTLNHFAKDLGLPLDIGAAAAVVAAGHVEAVDVAECNGHVFVNNSSIGVYPFLVEEREAERTRRVLAPGDGACGRRPAGPQHALRLRRQQSLRHRRARRPAADR
jgi:diacylglycerol kinase family enzyme